MKEKIINYIEDLEGYEQEYYKTSRKVEILQQRIDKAIEYGKSCIIEDLDVDKLDEEYKDIFKIAYEIHKHYLEILGDKENE